MERSEKEITLNFPLSSKRLKLYQLQGIAKALGLPSASSDDLLVMISGKLTESDHNPSDVQVVATLTEEGEELSLQDFNGIFFTVPIGKTGLSRISSPVSGKEMLVPTLVSDSSRTTPDLDIEVTSELDDFTLQDKGSFSNEEKHLEQVLSLLSAELATTRLQLQAAQKEVTQFKKELSAQQENLLELKKRLGVEEAKVKQLVFENEALQQQLSCSQVQDLKQEVNRATDRIKQLWQTNCQQLLSHDNLMFEKEEELKLLQGRMQQMEIELVKLKEDKTDLVNVDRQSTSTAIPFLQSHTLGLT